MLTLVYWIVIFTILTGLTIQSLVGVIQTYLQFNVMTTTGVNLINILWAAFEPTDAESAKLSFLHFRDLCA